MGVMPNCLSLDENTRKFCACSDRGFITFLKGMEKKVQTGTLDSSSAEVFTTLDLWVFTLFKTHFR